MNTTGQPFRSRSFPRGRNGFSLVETVLALAVMGLAISVLLGLLPHGLDMARKAGVSAGEARITADILAELSQAEWDDLGNYDNDLLFFDDQGVRIEQQGASSGGLASYVARIQLPGFPTLPGAVSNSPDLQRVVIQVAASANPQLNFDAPAASYSTYVSIIGRSN